MSSAPYEVHEVNVAARAGAVHPDGLTVDFCVGVTSPFVAAGQSWEVYGHWHADPAQLRTEVYYLLQPVGGGSAS